MNHGFFPQSRRLWVAALVAAASALAIAGYVALAIQPVPTLVVPVLGGLLPVGGLLVGRPQAAFGLGVVLVATFAVAGMMTVGPLFALPLAALVVGWGTARELSDNRERVI